VPANAGVVEEAEKTQAEEPKTALVPPNAGAPVEEEPPAALLPKPKPPPAGYAFVPLIRFVFNG
jgi:hypothetical protein